MSMVQGGGPEGGAPSREDFIRSMKAEAVSSRQNQLIDGGKIGDARRLLGTWLERRAGDVSSEADMRRVELARTMLYEGDVDESDRDLNSILQRDPNNSWAQSLLGQIEVRRGHFDRARGLFERAREADRDNHEASLFLDGNINDIQGRVNTLNTQSSTSPRENIEKAMLEDASRFISSR